MIVAGFIMFVANGISSVSSFGKTFNPTMLVISIVLFMGGAIVLAIKFSVSAKNKMKNLMNSSDSSEDNSFFGHTLKTIQKQLEKTNLELDNDIKDLKTKNNSRKCPNCGAAHIDSNGKCPYCGQ